MNEFKKCKIVMLDAKNSTGLAFNFETNELFIPVFDSLNHKEENLILLCPNCHSLTAGHSTSKGNGRRYYREQYHKNKNL